MHRRLDHLRLGVGLAHAAPGARLLLHTAGGGEFVAGSGPDADIDLCSLRRVVMASSCPEAADVSQYIQHLELSGSLAADSAGVYRRSVGGPGGPEIRERWFATLLRPERVRTLIDQVAPAPSADGDPTATLKPDPGLGMTAVRIAVGPSRRPYCLTEPGLDEAARSIFEACVIDELLHSAATTSGWAASDHSPGT